MKDRSSTRPKAARHARASGVCAALLALASVSAAAAGSDVVVVRVGDGAAALTTDSAPVFLERFATDGTLRATLALPTADSGYNGPFTLSGAAGGEGALAVTATGIYLTLAGYATKPGTANVSTSSSIAIPRIVMRVENNGLIDDLTFLDAAFSGGSVRSAVSFDGHQMWVGGNSSSGSAGGAWFVSFSSGGAATQVMSAPSNVRVLGIHDGQLFGDSTANGSSSFFRIGSGLPQATGQAASALPGVATTQSPYGFVLFDRDGAVPGLDTLYLADDRSVANGGGIRKWTFDGATWTLAATFKNNIGAGVRGLCGEVVGSNVVLYATTADAANRLVRIVDDGSASPAGQVIATAATDTAYRGVALAWVVPHADVVFVDGFQ